MAFITAEGIIVPASTDNYNLTTDVRAMANSIRSVVSVADRTAAAAVATAMSADGRGVTDINPLIYWNRGRQSLEVIGSSASYGSELQITKLTLTVAQSLTNAIFTTLSWNSALIQPDSQTWSAGSNPDRITARQVGIYQITVTAGLQNSGITTGTTRMAIQIVQSGSVSRTEGVMGEAANDGALSYTTFLNMAALDYIQVQMFHETGAAKNTGTAVYSQPIVTMRKL